MIVKKSIYIILFLVLLQACSSSDTGDFSIDELNKYFENLKNHDFTQARSIINDNNSSVSQFLKYYSYLIEDNGQSSIADIPNGLNNLQITNNPSEYELICQNLINAEINLFYLGEKQKSFEFYREAYIRSKKLKSNELKKHCLIRILKFYEELTIQSDKDFVNFLDDLKDFCKNSEDLIHYYSLKFRLFSQSETYNTKKSTNQRLFDQLFVKYDSVVQKIDKENKLNYYYLVDKGNYNLRKDTFSESKHLFLKRNILNRSQKLYLRAFDYLGEEKFYNRLYKEANYNLARTYRVSKNDHKLGLKTLELIDGCIEDRDSLKDRFISNRYKADHLAKLGEYKLAFLSEKEATYARIKWDMQRHRTNLSRLLARLDTAEKEKRILELRFNWIISLFSAILVLVVSLVVIKNSRRKRLLAVQEKELETQKNLTLLKEQEISTINAMVEGQEKERKRVAEDLHDNLGSVIATLKLHFDNLRINRETKKIDQETLFDKTEGLIDEAYKKVRSIAHAKNSGVIANQGLLVAVQMMAEKISSANTIQIEVIDYGLEKPIENSLEISLFRIVQELTTNIIKHAKAEHATINISQDQDDITILIEDNGVGMNASQIDSKKGMGIHSIKTRVEHLEGSFTIDSTPTKGTTIIINVPT